MQVIIVNGPGGSGKDTLEGFVSDIIMQNNQKAEKVSMVTYVKQIAEKCGWDGGKNFADRKFLSDLKQALANWNDSPYEYVKLFIKQMEINQVDVVFVDAREAEDIDRLKKDFGAITVLIKREALPKAYGNIADDNVYNYTYDYVVENNGTLDELKQSAETFYKDILMTDKLIKLVDEGVFDRN